jgi:hypothetical protein
MIYKPRALAGLCINGSVPPWGKKKEEKFTPQMLGGRCRKPEGPLTVCHQNGDREETDGWVHKQYFPVRLQITVKKKIAKNEQVPTEGKVQYSSI